jgi:DNA topoisomerase-1
MLCMMESFRSIKKDDDVYTIELKRALEILSEVRAPRGSTLITDFGRDHKLKKKVAVYNGRYGPYIKVGTKNVSLPEEHKSEEAAAKLKLEQVLKIIEEALG